MTPQTPPQKIISRFFRDCSQVSVTPLGQGNINDTFLIRSIEQSIVLQRINKHVFPNPDILIKNLHQLNQHLSPQLSIQKQRWEDVTLVPAMDGALSVRDSESGVWRALSYIGDSVCFVQAKTELQAEQTGWALGHFHSKLDGLDPARMQIPLPGFHNLNNYLKQYDYIQKNNKKNNSPEIQWCQAIIRENRKSALFLQNRLCERKSTTRIIHGDPKIANVLFDKESGLAVSLIDLDTVGPGFIQHDIGDCLRSVCNPAGEENGHNEVTFDLTLCENTLNGYAKAAKGLLTSYDAALIYDGIQAITYELGLRFFSDFLQGGIYFKCSKPEDILTKAMTQFTLLQDIKAKESAIRILTQQLCNL